MIHTTVLYFKKKYHGMQTTTVWKCYRCDMIFKKETTATIHNDVFKHPVQKIETTLFA